MYVEPQEEVAPGEAALERRQRLAPAPLAVGEHLRHTGGPPAQGQEARDPDVRLDLVLLEEHPRVHAGALDRVGRQVLGALGQVEQDRAGLGEVGAVVELEHRDPAVGVAGEVLGRARLAREQVELDALVARPDLVEHHARLQAVARGGVLVEDQAASAPSSSSSSACASSAAITNARCSSKSTPSSSAPCAQRVAVDRGGERRRLHLLLDRLGRQPVDALRAGRRRRP